MPTLAAFQSSAHMVREIVELAQPADEREWVPQGEQIWFRPLMLDRTTGTVANLLRVRRGGNLGRHIHNAPVFGYVIKGSWRYLEHDWVASQGSFVYEPPGEVHTLVVDAQGEHDEMITFFIVQGGLIKVDDDGKPVGYDNSLTKIALCERWYAQCGLGIDHVQRFVR
ncbi:2,4'-dihydroxyacetophenone dioxygenase family protein [Variovorax boronicumulans]|uniref:2,4'-dihydroxyacetophenone dioxygenase family protein n=1 Tax=Variovorax boronicumulans TaxID=436515 RepID=UPI00214CE4B4